MLLGVLISPALRLHRKGAKVCASSLPSLRQNHSGGKVFHYKTEWGRWARFPLGPSSIYLPFPADGRTEGDAVAPATTHRRDSPGCLLPSRISVPTPTPAASPAPAVPQGRVVLGEATRPSPLCKPLPCGGRPAGDLLQDTSAPSMTSCPLRGHLPPLGHG